MNADRQGNAEPVQVYIINRHSFNQYTKVTEDWNFVDSLDSFAAYVLIP